MSLAQAPVRMGCELAVVIQGNSCRKGDELFGLRESLDLVHFQG